MAAKPLVKTITNYGEMQNIRIPILMHLDIGWGWKVGIRSVIK